jgi:hypothetical protein
MEISVARFRHAVTWLLFVASLVALFVSCKQIKLSVQMLGMDYPRSIFDELPVLTEWFLGNLTYLNVFLWTIALAVLVAVGFIMRFVPAGDVRLHYVSLMTSVVYHFVVMLWATFTLAFFVLPAFKAGI